MALSLSLGAIGPLNEWKDVTNPKTVGNQSKTRSPYYLGQWLDAGCHRPTVFLSLGRFTNIQVPFFSRAFISSITVDFQLGSSKASLIILGTNRLDIFEVNAL
ncbi:hypothetical protein CsSME_00015095 [Camellia sinensis var. sinensis]